MKKNRPVRKKSKQSPSSSTCFLCLIILKYRSFSAGEELEPPLLTKDWGPVRELAGLVDSSQRSCRGHQPHPAAADVKRVPPKQQAGEWGGSGRAICKCVLFFLFFLFSLLDMCCSRCRLSSVHVCGVLLEILMETSRPAPRDV